MVVSLFRVFCSCFRGKVAIFRCTFKNHLLLFGCLEQVIPTILLFPNGSTYFDLSASVSPHKLRGNTVFKIYLGLLQKLFASRCRRKEEGNDHNSYYILTPT